MKKIKLIVLSVLFLLTSTSVWAQKRSRSSGTNSGYGTFGSYGSSAPVETSFYDGSSESKWAIGLASNETLLSTNDTALTATYSLSSHSIVQGFFYYFKNASVDTNSLGALYKYTLSGNSTTGFHVGGGLAFGKLSPSFSFFNLMGVAGFHFGIHKRVSIHVDGGLTISNYDNAQGKQSGTYISGASDHFGVSFLYAL